MANEVEQAIRPSDKLSCGAYGNLTFHRIIEVCGDKFRDEPRLVAVFIDDNGFELVFGLSR